MRKLRRSMARYNLKQMGVEQMNKQKETFRGRLVPIKSKFSRLWRQVDHFIPHNTKRKSKVAVKAA